MILFRDTIIVSTKAITRAYPHLGNVRSEWRLICATHNLLKLFRSGWKMKNGAFEQLTVPNPRSPVVVLHSSVVRLPETEYGSSRFAQQTHHPCR